MGPSSRSEDLIAEEAQKEADRRYPETSLAPENDQRAEDFIAGAEWQASRAPQPTEDDREALANLIPLGFTERDPYRDTFEAADAILSWMREQGFRRAPAEPARELAMSPEHVKETAESLHFPAEPERNQR